MATSMNQTLKSWSLGLSSLILITLVSFLHQETFRWQNNISNLLVFAQFCLTISFSFPFSAPLLSSALPCCSDLVGTGKWSCTVNGERSGRVCLDLSTPIRSHSTPHYITTQHFRAFSPHLLSLYSRLCLSFQVKEVKDMGWLSYKSNHIWYQQS